MCRRAPTPHRVWTSFSYFISCELNFIVRAISCSLPVIESVISAYSDILKIFPLGWCSAGGGGRTARVIPLIRVALSRDASRTPAAAPRWNKASNNERRAAATAAAAGGDEECRFMGAARYSYTVAQQRWSKSSNKIVMARLQKLISSSYEVSDLSSLIQFCALSCCFKQNGIHWSHCRCQWWWPLWGKRMFWNISEYASM